MKIKNSPISATRFSDADERAGAGRVRKATMKKMKSNYINIHESQKDKHIYRTMSFERMAEMFLTQKMVLVKPKLWDDPFENFILNYFEEENKGDSFDFNFRNSLYANCWTFQNRSDALWRIYSPNKDEYV